VNAWASGVDTRAADTRLVHAVTVARLFSLLAIALVFVVARPARALEHDVQHWHNVFSMARLQPPALSSPSPVVVHLEVQPRFSLLQTPGPTVTLMRAAIGLELAPGLTAWAGVGSIPAYRAPSWTMNELRFWQQVLYTKRLAGGVQLMWRGRLEERMFESTGADVDVARPMPLGWRARALLRASVDVPGTDRRFAGLVWDEPFTGIVGVPGKSALGFDQNRAFVGGIVRPTPWLGFEVGYINVLVGDPTKDGSRMLHVLSATTTLNAL
jgi:hypothetical protein